MFDWFQITESYWISSMLMGLGIALDTAVIAIISFASAPRNWKTWTLPVTIAHIVFPAVGYYSWWYAGHVSPNVIAPLGIIAALHVAMLLVELIYEWADINVQSCLSRILDRVLPHRDVGNQVGLFAIIIVSIDAFFSGPAKAAQAEVANWSQSQVILSFLIAGAVVACVAQIAVIIANSLRSIRYKNLRTLTVWCLGSKYLQVAVIGAFGILSLWSGLSLWVGGASLTYSLIIAASLTALIFWRLSDRLYNVQINSFGQTCLREKT